MKICRIEQGSIRGAGHVSQPTVYKGRSPYIGTNGNWFAWSDEQQAYVDTGVGARGINGTDASVTAQNIQNALGYVPAKSGDLSSVEARVTGLEENPVFPEDDDILVMSAETGLIDPLTDSDGKFFVEGDGMLYVL